MHDRRPLDQEVVEVKTILHVCDVEAAPERVWNALTTEEGLAGWWSTSVKADITVGGVIHWMFEPGFNPDMEITELVENQRVTWQCVGGHDPWLDNTFHFQIESRGDERCRLRFRQDYARELDDDSYGIYNFNWGYYISSLQKLAETGEGRPFSP